jgi:mRNA deadenylase 3'-5' endonuclease subunit Ccr4
MQSQEIVKIAEKEKEKHDEGSDQPGFEAILQEGIKKKIKNQCGYTVFAHQRQAIHETDEAGIFNESVEYEEYGQQEKEERPMA